jgi:curved DNA-binding protein CbpA
MTHYDALGVSNNASDDEIKKSYRTLSLRHHPDRGGSKEKFQEISAAYDVLSDPDIRQGIKEYSNWPTIPQVYVNGEFLGGSDILIELYQKGELQEKIEVAIAS